MKFCTCEPKKPKGSYDHVGGCDYYKVKPASKDERIAYLEKRITEVSASEMLLCLILDRKAEPVEVSIETYDNPQQTITIKVWPQRKDDGIVWIDGGAHWLGSWTSSCDSSHHYYLKDLASKANAVYVKHWSGK